MSLLNIRETMKRGLFRCVLLLMFLVSPAVAGEADVLHVEVSRSVDKLYTFAVSVEHADTGWDHYADKWEILDDKDDVLGERILYHPHVDEQPFTRRLGGVEIPANIKKVKIRAHDSVHGYGGRAVIVVLP